MKSLSILLGVTSALAIVAPLASAQQNTPVQEGAAPQKTPPTMPAQFDRATIERLIAEVEKGQNATVLQFGYLMGRKVQPLPIREGLELLKAAAAREQIGSLRWFQLQALLGFGGLHIPNPPQATGALAYKTLLENSDKAQTPEAVSIVRRAIFDAMSLLPTRNGGVLRITGVAPLALRKELQFLSQGQPDKRGINWGEIQRAIHVVGPDLSEIVEEALLEPKYAKSPAFTRIAVEILTESKPAAAATLLAASNPEVNPDLDFPAAYSRLLSAYARTGAWEQAIGTARQRIDRFNNGRVWLSYLFLNSGDDKEFEALLTIAAQPAIAESEVADALELSVQEEWGAFAIRQRFAKAIQPLLLAYLTGQRTRNVETELKARLTVARILATSGEKERAVALLNIAHLNPPPSSRLALSRYRAVERLRNELSGQAAPAAIR